MVKEVLSSLAERLASRRAFLHPRRSGADQRFGGAGAARGRRSGPAQYHGRGRKLWQEPKLFLHAHLE